MMERFLAALLAATMAFHLVFPSAAALSKTEQNASRCVADVSMEATNSFGKLLLAGMEEENSSDFSSNNRIIDIKLNGKTATVKYLVEEDADLVVGIYADDDEQQMVASGTVAVTSTTDGTATVAITGEIPEYYVIKGYLFDKAEHAPLCDPFTDTVQTKGMVDIANATVKDFPEERVINLDADDTTNFAVVKQDVTLLTPEEAEAGKNKVTQQDDENLNYKIDDAGDEIKNLQKGDIFTYAYAPGEMLIVKVDTIDVSGDSVSIHGDDTLEITEVFEALKIEESAGSSEMKFTDEDRDSAVTYLGTQDHASIEDTNKFAIEDGAISDVVPIADATVHDFKIEGNVTNEKDGALKVSVKGSLSLNLNVDFAYYISLGKQYVALSNDLKMSGEISVEGQISGSIPLGACSPLEKVVKEKTGLVIEIKPKVVVEVSAKFEFQYQYQQYTAVAYTSGIGLQNLSAPGNGKIEPIEKNGKNSSTEIKVFIGLEVGPKVQLWDTVMDFEVKLKGGGQAVLTTLAPEEGVKHECEHCFDITISVIGKITDKLVIFKNDLTKVSISGGGPIPSEIKFIDVQIGEFYWSLDHGEFGIGKCPYVSPIITDNTIIDSGSCGEEGENIVWKLDNKGVLIIDGNGKIKNYKDETCSPWTSRKDIVEIIVENGITRIGSWAFYKCENLTCVTIPSSVKEIENGAFAECSGLETITIPQGIENIGESVFYGCKELKEIEIPNSVGNIGEGAFYGCVDLKKAILPKNLSAVRANLFDGCDSLSELKIPESVIEIGLGAFRGCKSLKSIVIPEMVTTIRDAAFEDCSGLTNVAIPECVQSIGNGAFRGCINLTNIELPNEIISIENQMFSGCTKLTTITLGEKIEAIDYSAFYNCKSLESVFFAGTKKEWRKININKNYGGNDCLLSATIHCINGDILPAVENSITMGKTTDENATLHAVFNGLTAGESYAVIVSRSEERPLDAENLIYVNQRAADADGVLDVPFISNEREAAYVVACRKGILPEKPKEDTKPEPPKPADSDSTGSSSSGTTKPDKPSGSDSSGSSSSSSSLPSSKPSSSSSVSNKDDGSGAIAAVVLLGGVAAVTAGVVLMMPVEVSGIVRQSDESVLGNATVQLVQEGKLAAQTMTDENGRFALEVRRGDYQMNIITTDSATGEQIVWSVQVAAPAENKDFVF